MKTKRCTNSSCRKVFRVESHRCPHCGKNGLKIRAMNAGSFAVKFREEREKCYDM